MDEPSVKMKLCPSCGRSMGCEIFGEFISCGSCNLSADDTTNMSFITGKDTCSLCQEDRVSDLRRPFCPATGESKILFFVCSCKKEEMQGCYMRHFFRQCHTCEKKGSSSCYAYIYARHLKAKRSPFRRFKNLQYRPFAMQILDCSHV